ncbi:hypothetical protein JM18_009588 [Phytophthora kernoviae]|uniref:Uncharacterized protein n=1 Tax=Phytophthora kernoviae TaxID=325452 RepID=A0A8T0LIA2_9STRA|nr:hypothetical protein JM18_009588 [Phytophthora kernoviae]KAG2502915.1 hypothetical protein JM16_009538 [Phytophthora kernoviae]
MSEDVAQELKCQERKAKLAEPMTKGLSEETLQYIKVDSSVRGIGFVLMFVLAVIAVIVGVVVSTSEGTSSSSVSGSTATDICGGTTKSSTKKKTMSTSIGSSNIASDPTSVSYSLTDVAIGDGVYTSPNDDRWVLEDHLYVYSFVDSTPGVSIGIFNVDSGDADTHGAS